VKRANSEPALAVPAVLKPVVAAFAGESISVEEGWGSSNVVLKSSGKIFVMLVGSEIVMKLPKSRVDELVAAEKGRRFDPRRDGRLMKEWVVLSSKTSKLTALAREAHAFVAGNRRKATTRARRARTTRASRTP